MRRGDQLWLILFIVIVLVTVGILAYQTVDGFVDTLREGLNQ